MKKIVIFVPAFNEEATIAKVVDSIPNKILGINTQVLVVNDGSTDGTAEIAREHGAVVKEHSHNQGVGKAFHTGLEAALELGADYMANIDADGQFSAEDIKKLLKPVLDEDADFVAADRFTQKNGKLKKPANMPTSKFYGNLLMAKLISLLAGQNFTDVSSGFRVYSKKTLLNLNLTGKFTYTQETFIDLVLKGLRIESVPVEVKYFPERKSKVANNLMKYGYRTFKIIVRTFRDYKPLLFFVYLSLAPLIIGLVTAMFFLTHYLQTGGFSPYKAVGFTSLYFLSAVFVLWTIGFLADMFVRLRINQEKIIYQQKLQQYRSE